MGGIAPWTGVQRADWKEKRTWVLGEPRRQKGPLPAGDGTAGGRGEGKAGLEAVAGCGKKKGGVTWKKGPRSSGIPGRPPLSVRDGLCGLHGGLG